MGLNRSKGNMYSWISHTHTHLGGECPHKCSYCYVNNLRFGRPEKYQGPIWLIGKELNVKYGKGKTIFIENCNDLFAEGIKYNLIRSILNHCTEWPDNTYVFQTKNPERAKFWTDCLRLLPDHIIMGTTIETNRDTYPMSLAPSPAARALFFKQIEGDDLKKFVTIEPIMNFDVDQLSEMVIGIKPSFVNIGADSKGNNLPEPPYFKVKALIKNIKSAGIDVKEKSNLKRLKEE